MSKPLILVTTANGRTGAATILELLKLGFPVRALVRSDDQRADGASSALKWWWATCTTIAICVAL